MVLAVYFWVGDSWFVYSLICLFVDLLVTIINCANQGLNMVYCG